MQSTALDFPKAEALAPKNRRNKHVIFPVIPQIYWPDR